MISREDERRFNSRFACPQLRFRLPRLKQESKTPLKSGTGVAAARSDYPASTNVSSPVQALSRRRVQKGKQRTPLRSLDEDDYPTDNLFVVGNDELSGEDSEDGFEPLREAGKPRSLAKRQLGTSHYHR